MNEVLKQMYQLLLTEPHAPTLCERLERIAREAIAELESQEPVALQMIKGELCYLSQHEDQSFGMWCPVTPSADLPFADGTNFYTTPPAQPAQRTWVELTEDEAFACQKRDYFETYRAIDAKLKEKNT